VWRLRLIICNARRSATASRCFFYAPLRLQTHTTTVVLANAHLYAHDNRYSDALWKRCKKNDRWECIECKTCTVCSQEGEDDKLLFCDECDRAYHMFCLNPPVTQQPGDEDVWKCPGCVRGGPDGDDESNGEDENVDDDDEDRDGDDHEGV
jgi:hypothetical protein